MNAASAWWPSSGLSYCPAGGVARGVEVVEGREKRLRLGAQSSCASGVLL